MIEFMSQEEASRWIKEATQEDHKRRTAKLHSYYIGRQYGLTSEQYEYQVKRQNGLCAICKNPPGKKRLSVDHDQASGRNRGLLCTRCNVGLGYFKDNPIFLRSAIEYIENFAKLVEQDSKKATDTATE